MNHKAIEKRLRDLDEYLKNPNICPMCKEPIVTSGTRTVCAGTLRRKKFCSVTCSILYNNTQNKNRGNLLRCTQCSTEYERWTHHASTLCKSCAKKTPFYEGGTLIQTRDRSYISWHARKTLQETQREKKCHVCGYDFYVEVCHIRAKATFPADTLLTTVNDPSNLVYLCPNHHKEFDRGKLTAEDLQP